MDNIGANRNRIAILGTVGKSDDVGKPPIFGCRCDPAARTIIADTHGNYNAAYVWIGAD